MSEGEQPPIENSASQTEGDGPAPSTQEADNVGGEAADRNPEKEVKAELDLIALAAKQCGLEEDPHEALKPILKKLGMMLGAKIDRIPSQY